MGEMPTRVIVCMYEEILDQEPFKADVSLPVLPASKEMEPKQILQVLDTII